MNHEHYHIRWSHSSGSKLDWEAFPTRDDAERRAKELVRPGENFTIEHFDGGCAQCAATTRSSSA